ncbi:MAG: putative Ig domain-containing protein [Acidimicrobiales bacterium]
MAGTLMLGVLTATVLAVSPATPAAAAGSQNVSAWSWGYNADGEFGNETTTNSSTPVEVSLPTGVTPTAIAGGYNSGYAIGSDGNVYAWGYNGDGELGNGTTTNSLTPVEVSLPSGVTPTAIASGGYSGYAIGSDGNLYAWGYGSVGELGNGTTTNSSTPVEVALPSGVTPRAIASGQSVAYAIGSDGNLYAWGYDGYGELGNGTTMFDSLTPVEVALPSGVTPTAIASGGYSGYAIGSDGHLYAWGDNGNGELGNGTTTNSSTPVEVSLPSGVTPTAIAGSAADGLSGYAIGSDGNLYAWGDNYQGELGNGTRTDSSIPVEVSLPSGDSPTAIAAGTASAYAIGSKGNLYDWGDNLIGGGLGLGATPGPVSLPAGVTATAVAAGSLTGYAIGSSGSVGDQCQPGYYSTTGNTPCTPAPPGTYVDTTGATSATECAPGSYNPNVGQTGCLLAPPNTYVDTTGARAPTPCPAGTFNLDSGSTSIAACVMVVVANPGNQSDYVGAPIVALSDSATNGVLPLAWRATGLPVGLSIDPSSGTVTGTPTTTCSCSVTLKVTDADGNTGIAGFTWTILPFGVATTSLPNARPGTPYGPATLQAGGVGASATGYTTTLKWGKVLLPKGLKLSSSGVLSGTPSAKLPTVSFPLVVNLTETVITLNGKKKVKTRTTVQATIPLTIT